MKAYSLTRQIISMLVAVCLVLTSNLCFYDGVRNAIAIEAETETVNYRGSEGIPVISGAVYTLSPIKNSSRVLDVSGASVQNGAPIGLWTPNGNAAQKFQFFYDAQNDYYTIKALHSNLLLAVAGSNAPNGAGIIQWVDNGTMSTRWKLCRNRTLSGHR